MAQSQPKRTITDGEMADLESEFDLIVNRMVESTRLSEEEKEQALALAKQLLRERQEEYMKSRLGSFGT